MPGAAISMAQKKLGFSTAATTLRPPAGQTWVVYGLVEIGSAPTMQWNDGTTAQDYVTSSQNLRVVAITNEWYLSCVAATATTGWLLTIALGFEATSFVEA